MLSRSYGPISTIYNTYCLCYHTVGTDIFLPRIQHLLICSPVTSFTNFVNIYPKVRLSRERWGRSHIFGSSISVLPHPLPAVVLRSNRAS